MTKPQLPLRCMPIMRELVKSEARQQNIPLSDKKALGELLMVFHEDSMESFFPSEELSGGFAKNPTPDLSTKAYEPIAKGLEELVFGNKITGRERQKLARQLRSAMDMMVDVYCQAKLGLKIRGPEAVFAYQKGQGLSEETRKKNKKLTDFNRLKRVGAYAFLANLMKPFFIPIGAHYEELVLNVAKKLGMDSNWNSTSFRTKFIQVINSYFNQEFKKTTLIPPGDQKLLK